jgi:cytochrome o ubiquinol oxidase subunit 2
MSGATTVPLQGGFLDPQGPIAAAERTIVLDAAVVMLAVIVPVILMTVAFAWWFRRGNASARRLPDFDYSGAIEVTVWSIPLLVVVFLAGMGWIGSHDLDPHRPLEGPSQPVDVDVIALDWKWLFVYPRDGVASVNHLVVPVGAPLRLRITSGTVMNSFLVPGLGSQMYAMSGMTTPLHLRADRPGRYAGLSANFSGDGFSDMRFLVDALAPADYAAWIAHARADGAPLDEVRWAALARAEVATGAPVFAQVDPALLDRIVGASRNSLQR